MSKTIIEHTYPGRSLSERKINTRNFHEIEKASFKNNNAETDDSKNKSLD